MKLFFSCLAYICFCLSLSVLRFKAREFKVKHGIEGWISYYIGGSAGLIILLGIALTWIKGNFQ